MKPPLIITSPLLPDFEAKLNEEFSLYRTYDRSVSKDEIRDISNQVRAVVTSGGAGLDRATMDGLPTLELIAVNGVGVDKIDLVEAARRGIKVATTPNVLNDSVADLAVALVLACARDLRLADLNVRSGSWSDGKSLKLGKTLRGSKVGIVGLGRIGSAIADRLEPFGVEIGYHNRKELGTSTFRYFPELVELARFADFLIVAVTGGSGSAKIVNRDVLGALGAQGYLVNVARGTCVDENALAQALGEGLIAGAGLDVFENEPFPDERLLAFDNVVLAPHIGSATIETRRAMAQLVVDHVLSHFAK